MSQPRPSQREPNTLRPLSAELSVLHRSDGSASLKCGNTHVMAAVHGPIVPRTPNRERYDCGVVSVAFTKGLMMVADATFGGTVKVSDGNGITGSNGNPASSSSSGVVMALPPGGGATECELEHFLKDTLSSCILLERYPRCVIQVVIQIVQSDGGVLGSAVNCAVMALMDAGVAMKGMPVATTCVVLADGGDDGENKCNTGQGNVVWLDPTAEEESGEGHSVVVLVTDTSSQPLVSNDNVSLLDPITKKPQTQQPLQTEQRIITSITFGSPLSLEGLISSFVNSQRSSAATVAFLRLAIEQKVAREAQTLWSF